jgi:hypothetical protein
LHIAHIHKQRGPGLIHLVRVEAEPAPALDDSGGDRTLCIELVAVKAATVVGIGMGESVGRAVVDHVDLSG